MASYTLQGFTDDASSPDLDATNLNEMDNAIKVGHDFADSASSTPEAGKAMVWPENASGTFDPVISFDGASVGVTYTERSGYWQKTGNRIDVGMLLKLSSKGSSTGEIRIKTLPEACGNIRAKRGSFDVFGSGMSCTGRIHGICRATGSTEMIIVSYTDAGVESVLKNNNITDTAEIFIGGSYFI